VTINGATTAYTYNTLDQITTAGAAQYTYDARGNLVKINDPVAGVTTYGYDAANRMISAAVPVAPGSATYSYDADGRLVSRTAGGAVRNYVWNDVTEYGDILFETDGSGAVVSTYTMGGNDLIQQIGNGNTNPAYYLKDGLGSVVGLTDPNGVETDRYRYEAYGQRTLFQGTTVNPYGYRSQRVDEVTGLVYLRARYYGPRIGRFTIRDKSEFRLDDPIDLNRYAYAGGDPINNFDPTGNAAAEEEAVVLSAEEEDTIINSYFVGRFDKALFTWVVDFFAANLAAGAIEAAFPYGKRIVSYITIAFGFVLNVNIGTKAENAALRASNTPASRKILLGYASEFEADPGGFRFALSGTRKPWKRLAPIIAGFFGLDNSLDFGSDQCASHAERKIANGAKGTILSIAPSRPVCMTCWNALKDKVDVLAPLGLRWCKQDPNKP
jgi:RHS repeat-associated protein